MPHVPPKSIHKSGVGVSGNRRFSQSAGTKLCFYPKDLETVGLTFRGDRDWKTKRIKRETPFSIAKPILYLPAAFWSMGPNNRGSKSLKQKQVEENRDAAISLWFPFANIDYHGLAPAKKHVVRLFGNATNASRFSRLPWRGSRPLALALGRSSPGPRPLRLTSGRQASQPAPQWVSPETLGRWETNPDNPCRSYIPSVSVGMYYLQGVSGKGN